MHIGTISTDIRLNDGMSAVLRNMSSSIQMFTTGLKDTQHVMSSHIDMTMFNGATKAMQDAMSNMALMERQAQQTSKAMKWNNVGSFNIIQGSGVERMNQEINQLKNMTNGATEYIKRLNTEFNKSSTRSILPQGAINDISHAENRFNSLISTINRFSNQDLNILNDSQANHFNSMLESMRRNIANVRTSITDMTTNMQSGNLTALNADVERFNSLMQQSQSHTRELTEMLNNARGFQWQTGNRTEIFNSSGMTRAVQEINSAQQMYQRLSQTQQRLVTQSSRMRLISPTALSDVNNLNSRIGNIGNTIQRLEREQRRLSRWDTSGINQYNSRIESLRNSMTRIVQEQEEWNQAILSNDIERVNRSYQRLAELTGNIERETRDNTQQQMNFNNALGSGVNHASALSNKLSSIGSQIKSYVGMYLGLNGIKKGVSVSDTYTNATSRLKLINAGLQTQDQLQQKIYGSVLRSRGAYNDTVNVIAKLGLLSQDTFKSNDELIYFSELMQKSFKLSGASIQERQAGMYQLTQAMASGRLQGDEFRSIRENAPMLANAIADFTGKDMGGLKEMSREGTITSEIIKNSLFSAAEQIEQRYATLPMTFGDIFNQMSSTATMSFSGLLEDINGFANSDFMKSITSQLPQTFGIIATDLSIIGTHISSFAISASPYIKELCKSFSQVGRYIISANGLMGTFFNNLSRIASSQSGLEFFNTLAGGAMAVAKSLTWVIETISYLNQHFGGFLPNLGSVIAGFTTFKMINSTLSPIISSLGNSVLIMTNYLNSMARASDAATSSQQALNMAMAANKFLFVASAVATLISALGGLVVGIGAVNEAAGLAANNTSFGSYSDEAWKLSENSNFSLPYAQRITDTKAEYQKQYDANLKIIEDSTAHVVKFTADITSEKAHDIQTGRADLTTIKRYNEYYDAFNAIGKAKQDNADLWRRQIKTLSSIVKESDKANEIEAEMEALKDSMKKGTPDIDKPDFTNLDIGSVGNVGSVDKINDTVDISSEDLRYMRDLAEREVINKFTQTTLVPKFEVHFGDVRETADVQEVIDALKRQLQEELATSANGIHL